MLRRFSKKRTAPHYWVEQGGARAVVRDQGPGSGIRGGGTIIYCQGMSWLMRVSETLTLNQGEPGSQR